VVDESVEGALDDYLYSLDNGLVTADSNHEGVEEVGLWSKLFFNGFPTMDMRAFSSC
jgi:hypothetical protein